MIIHKYDKEKNLCVLVRPRFHNPKDQTIDELIKFGLFLIEQAIIETEKYIFIRIFHY